MRPCMPCMGIWYQRDKCALRRRDKRRLCCICDHSHHIQTYTNTHTDNAQTPAERERVKLVAVHTHCRVCVYRHVCLLLFTRERCHNIAIIMPQRMSSEKNSDCDFADRTPFRWSPQHQLASQSSEEEITNIAVAYLGWSRERTFVRSQRVVL